MNEWEARYHAIAMGASSEDVAAADQLAAAAARMALAMPNLTPESALDLMVQAAHAVRRA